MAAPCCTSSRWSTLTSNIGRVGTFGENFRFSLGHLQRFCRVEVRHETRQHHEARGTRMKIAVVGLGYWGPKLLRNLVALRGADRIVVVDRDLARVEAMCREYPAVQFAFSIEDVLDDDEVQGVIIATPVESHAKLAG